MSLVEAVVNVMVGYGIAVLSTAEEKPAKWRLKTLPLRDAGNGGWAG
jgi:hypothetical protein